MGGAAAAANTDSPAVGRALGLLQSHGAAVRASANDQFIARDVIVDAIQAGGSSLRDHIQADGTLGYFQHSFRTYDREGEPCLTDGCRGTVERIVQSGRSTFYCRRCQK